MENTEMSGNSSIKQTGIVTEKRRTYSKKQTGIFTSFRKKGTETVNIRGTRIAVQNAQLLTSTGSSTLDFFIGGGLAVGTVCLIEEDKFSTYSNVLFKYFLAEGVVNCHSILLSSGTKPSKQIIKNLPAIRVAQKPKISDDGSASETLKIAWRYPEQPVVSKSGVKAIAQNHGYDLSKKMPVKMLDGCSITTWDSPDFLAMQNETSQSFLSPSYCVLLEKIKSDIEAGGFQTSNKKCENIMRIAVCSIGLPTFNSTDTSCHERHILRFLYLLKALLRKSFAVAMVTVPSYIVQNQVAISRIRQTCDTVISLESFVGSNKASNPLFKEFEGLLQVTKLPVLNTFMYPTLTTDLAFKLKRKSLLIEPLHLPPDFEDSEPNPDSLGCSGLPSKLDF